MHQRCQVFFEQQIVLQQQVPAAFSFICIDMMAEPGERGDCSRRFYKVRTAERIFIPQIQHAFTQQRMVAEPRDILDQQQTYQMVDGLVVSAAAIGAVKRRKMGFIDARKNFPRKISCPSGIQIGALFLCQRLEGIVKTDPINFIARKRHFSSLLFRYAV